MNSEHFRDAVLKILRRHSPNVTGKTNELNLITAITAEIMDLDTSDERSPIYWVINDVNDFVRGTKGGLPNAVTNCTFRIEMVVGEALNATYSQFACTQFDLFCWADYLKPKRVFIDGSNERWLPDWWRRTYRREWDSHLGVYYIPHRK